MANNINTSLYFTTGYDFTFTAEPNGVIVQPAILDLAGGSFTITSPDYILVKPATLNLNGLLGLIASGGLLSGVVGKSPITFRDYQHITGLVDPESNKHQRPVFEFGKNSPNQFSGTLTDVDNFSVISQNLGSCYVQKSFTSTFYGRIHVYPNKIVLGVIASNNNIPITIYNTTENSENISGISFGDLSNAGLGLELGSSTVVPSGIVTATIKVEQTGVPIIEGWSTLTTTSLSALVSFSGLRAIILPFPTNLKFDENFSWFTDVMSSRHGEMRKSISEFPSIDLNYSYIFNDQTEAQYGATLASLVSVSPIGVPLWSKRVKGISVTAGNNQLIGDFSKLYLNVGEFIFIMDSTRKFEIASITDIGVNSLTIANSFQTTFTNAFVTPFVTGYQRDPIEFTRSPSGLTEYNLKVTCDVYKPNIPNLTPPVFDNLPILDYPNEVTGGEKFSYQTETNLYNNQIGIRTILPIEDYNRSKRILTLVSTHGQKDLELLKVMFYLKGKYTPFLLPSGFSMLEPKSGISAGNANMSIVDIDLSRVSGGYLRINRDNTKVFKFTCIRYGSLEQLTLNPIPSFSLTQDQIKCMELLTKVRASTDNLTLTYSPQITRLAIPVITIL